MKQVTLERGNALTKHIAEHKEHLRQANIAVQRQDDKTLTSEAKLLGVSLGNNINRLLLQEHLMPMPVKSFLQLYIMQVERKIAELQAELDNLSDSNAV